MSAPAITNEMLYEFLKEFKADMLQFKTDVYKRFEQVDKRFEQIERRLDRIESDIVDIRSEIRRDREKLQEVYDSRHQITVKFTRAWSLASFFIAVFASALTLSIAKGF